VQASVAVYHHMHDEPALSPSDQTESWQKSLWKKQNFDDNYIPPTFLSSLQRNSELLVFQLFSESKITLVNLRRYTYLSVLRKILPVTQHLASTALFLSIFARLRSDLLDPRVLVYVASTFSILGFTIYEYTSLHISSSPFTLLAQAIKSSILVFLALASLAPVLRTLTAATSDDSIWALAASLFVLHALLADYTPEPFVWVRAPTGVGEFETSQPQGG
jgi:phosphatidylinositol glycan class C protein